MKRLIEKYMPITMAILPESFACFGDSKKEDVDNKLSLCTEIIFEALEQFNKESGK